MRIIETEVNISNDHRLSIQLPEDIAAGAYEVAIVMNPQPKPSPKATKTDQDFFALAGIWENKGITAESIRTQAWGETNPSASKSQASSLS